MQAFRVLDSSLHGLRQTAPQVAMGPGRAKTADREVFSGSGRLRCRSQYSANASCYGGSNGARLACCLHFERWNRVRGDISQRGYALIAEISGPGPMMLMTRVRL